MDIMLIITCKMFFLQKSKKILIFYLMFKDCVARKIYISLLFRRVLSISINLDESYWCIKFIKLKYNLELFAACCCFDRKRKIV